jgi:hypothetical protein
VMRWMKRLKFPDGYAIGVKRCVNVMAGKIQWVKSHDYHIIMEIQLDGGDNFILISTNFDK